MNQYEQAKKLADAVYKILETAHQTAKATVKAKPLLDAISFYEREKAISLIYPCISEHRSIIDATSPITGRFVVDQEGFYDDKSDEHIRTDLQFLVCVIYLKYAWEYGLNAIVDKAMKKIFGSEE